MPLFAKTRRKKLLRIKPFLLRIASADTAREVNRVLSFATDRDLEDLLGALHLIVAGVVDFPKDLFELLSKKKLLKVLRLALEDEASLKRLISGKRDEQLVFYRKIANVLPSLTSVFLL